MAIAARRERAFELVGASQTRTLAEADAVGNWKAIAIFGINSKPSAVAGESIQ